MHQQIPKRYDKEFILSRVLVVGQCWEWQGAIGSAGYGNVLDNSSGRTFKSHRLAYQLFVGDIGDQWVLHRCDNRKCCNPEHLFLGDHQENMRDMARKNRARAHPGTHNPNAKLSEQDIAAIKTIPRRSMGGMTNAEIAFKYGVHRETVRRYRAEKEFKFEKIGASYRERR